MHKKTKIRLISWLAFVAAILYTSWVIGYFVNPNVAYNGSASDLAAMGQPLRLIFVAGDIIVAAIIFSIVGLSVSENMSKNIRTSLMFFAIFGAFTGLAAFFPLPCAQGSVVCIDSMFSERVVFHSLFGSLATFFLFIATLFAIKHYYSSGKWPTGVGLTLKILLIIWVFIGIIGYAFNLSIDNRAFAALLQRLFLAGTALLIWQLPNQIAKSLIDKEKN